MSARRPRLYLVTLRLDEVPGLKHLDEVLLEAVVRAHHATNATQVCAKNALQETQAPWLDGRCDVAEIGIGIGVDEHGAFPDEGLILARTRG